MSDCADTDSDNQPSWVKDMIAHIQFNRASEFSTSGTGDDVSVYWEPHLTSVTDPFTSHSKSESPADIILLGHDHSDFPSGEFQIPPSQRSRPSPTRLGSPYSDTDSDSDAPSQPSTVLAPHSTSTDGSYNSPPASSAATIPTNLIQGGLKISPSITPLNEPDTDVELAALVLQLPSYQRLCLDKISKNHRPTAIKMKTKVGLMGYEAQTSATRQTCKRKIVDDIGAEYDADKENISPSCTMAIKRICREKTGTDWQLVLDINKKYPSGVWNARGALVPYIYDPALDEPDEDSPLDDPNDDAFNNSAFLRRGLLNVGVLSFSIFALS
ncbi:hypothetical protein F4604DRAFT_1930979 [Suillus subluteus]|nr:hypothetical protein F4604DRAFT_1930979 [Suillus subluteus]